jgi:hypothetical protein
LTYTTPDGISFVNGTISISPGRDFTTFAEPLFFGNGTVPALKANCPTSNCTWDPFETLGVCSACEDISQDMQFGCITAPADWLSNVTLADTTYPIVTACGYSFFPSTDDPPLFMSGYILNEDGSPGEALSTRIFPLTSADPFSRVPVFGGSLHFKDIHNPITDLLISGTPEGGPGAYRNLTPTAHECVLYWCVKTVESAFYWGTHYENTTKTVQLSTSEEYPWLVTNNSAGDVHILYLDDFSLTLPPGDRPELHNNTFGLSNLTALQAAYLFDEIGPSYVTTDNETSIPQYRWLNGGQFFFGFPTVVPMPTISNPWLPSNNNLTAHMEMLAEVMTAVIRNTVDDSNQLQLVNGTAWAMRTAVKVSWEWMILPLLLLAFSLVFLFSTIVKSSREEGQVGIWKTSIIAVLFNGLGDEVQRSFGPNCRMGEAREKARELRVKLLPD